MLRTKLNQKIQFLSYCKLGQNLQTLFFQFELKTKCLIEDKNVELQANLEEFVGKEKGEDESDSDDTDSGMFQLSWW